MVGADASRQGEIQFLGLGDAFGRQIGRPERLQDQHVRIDQLPFEDGSGLSLSDVTMKV